VIIVVVAYIIEVILEATKNSLTLGRMIWLLACLFCLGMFLTEIVFICKQTPTIDILNKTNEVIDFSTLVYNFQMLYYVQAVNLILLIAFLFPFFQFLTDI
jgi:ABC-type transport system involved in multi-copper enzyme maturation permease subunit